MSFMADNQFSISLLLVAASAGFIGYSYGDKDREILEAKLAAKHAAITTVQQITMPTVHTERIEYRDKIKKVEIEVPKIIDRPVYKNVCLDDDGVKAFNTYMGAK